MAFEKVFKMTDEHIKLLSSMYVSWNEGYPEFGEFGAPKIDSKRPYGNSDILIDMYEILEDELLTEEQLEDDDFLKSFKEKYLKLQKETETALQIVLHTKKFEAGTYGLIGFGKAWIKID